MPAQARSRVSTIATTAPIAAECQSFLDTVVAQVGRNRTKKWSCNRAEHLTTNLGVGGSNPSGRATYEQNWALRPELPHRPSQDAPAPRAGHESGFRRHPPLRYR